MSTLYTPRTMFTMSTMYYWTQRSSKKQASSANKLSQHIQRIFHLGFIRAMFMHNAGLDSCWRLLCNGIAKFFICLHAVAWGVCSLRYGFLLVDSAVCCCICFLMFFVCVVSSSCCHAWLLPHVLLCVGILYVLHLLYCWFCLSCVWLLLVLRLLFSSRRRNDIIVGGRKSAAEHGRVVAFADQHKAWRTRKPQ